MSILKAMLSLVIWNNPFEATPDSGDIPSEGPARFQGTKLGVRERIEKEHTMNLSSGLPGNDGWHKNGSAKQYYQESAPTTRPDGVTLLTADDNGRAWIRSTDKRRYVYVHPDWVPETVLDGGDNTLSGDNTFSGSNTFTGSNTFSGDNNFSGDNSINVSQITGLTYGDIGTYVIAASTSWVVSTEYLPGTTVSGDTLIRSSRDTTSDAYGSGLNTKAADGTRSDVTIDSGESESLGLSGTWMLVTRIVRGTNALVYPIGLFLRTA